MVQIHTHHSEDRFAIYMYPFILNVNVKIALGSSFHKINDTIRIQTDSHFTHLVHALSQSFLCAGA